MIVLIFKNCSISIFRMDLLSQKYVEKEIIWWFVKFCFITRKKKYSFLYLTRLFPDVFNVVHLRFQIPNFFTFMIYLHDSIPTYKTNYDSTQHWHCIFHPCNNSQMRKVRIIGPVSLIKKTEIKRELELEFYSRPSDSNLVSADNIKLPIWIWKFSFSHSFSIYAMLLNSFASLLISVHLNSFQLRFFLIYSYLNKLFLNQH